MPLPDRSYQPSLLWARAQQWAQDHAPEDAPALGPTDLQLYIYRTDKPGAYRMHGPKLYWADEPTGSAFGNCDQSALLDNREVLGEVVLSNRRRRTSDLLGATYEEAWDRLTARPGPGRPSVGDATLGSITLPDELKRSMETQAQKMSRSMAELRREAYRRITGDSPHA